MAAQRNRNNAIRRLKRDLIELQRANILSIAAQPLDDNIFEWHVNIKPTDGVYSGVYFHLIMQFPENYPTNPPTVKVQTAISHPNIFGSFLCLSMLRPHTGTVPYEGWSGAYSVTSVLMQLQSFLFAEKIDQDGGYQLNAQLSDHDVKRSITVCKTFKCQKCSHSHDTPWPKVKGPPEALIKVFPTDPESGHVVVQGSACQTTHTYWVGAYGEFGCNYGKVFYEAFINWTGDKWAKDNIRGGLCRFGFGTEYASVCGRSQESFGYGGTGMYSWANQFNKFGQSFTKDDTITVAVDFETSRIYFAKNGRLMEPNRELYIPDYLQGALLFPILSFKNSRAEFNFGSPKRPCKWLINQGFKSLEQVALEQGTMDGENDDDYKEVEDMPHNVDWHNHGIIDELWLSIFEALQVQEIFSAQFVCKKWCKILATYNVMERNEIYCYYTKAKLGQKKGGKVLGIGLNIKPRESGFGVDFHSQMDILSRSAWQSGCKIGVWGEPMTHFLPLALNKQHAKVADSAIYEYLKKIRLTLAASNRGYSNRNSNDLDKYIEKNECLQSIDTLITMMNQIVVQFVMGNENTNTKQVSMVMCEKVVLGYCALHHLLLYLANKYKTTVNNFANRKVSYFINRDDGHNKNMCKDLGKFLIYLMISSQYTWNDVCSTFVKEVFTRNVRWMVQDAKYKKYDTTKVVHNRLRDTFEASKISRRLVMFQVWFMKNNANETLQAYNQRLGRPRLQIRNAIVGKTKYILGSKSWWDYFDELGVIIKDDNSIDQLLRFAIYNSKKSFYHKSYNNRLLIQKVTPPLIRTNDPNYKGPQKFVKEGPSVGIKSSGRGWGKPNNNARGSAWRGRGRGGTTRYQNQGQRQQPGQPQQHQQPGQAPMRGRGRGFAPRGPSQNQYQNRPQNQGGRGFTSRGPPQNQYQQRQRPQQGGGRGFAPRGPPQNQYQQQRPQQNQYQQQNVQRPQQTQPQYQQGGGRGFAPRGPVQNNQYQQQRAPQQNQNQYQHITPGMRNALNNNGGGNNYQPGSQPGSGNNNNMNDQEMPQRQSKSSRNRRRRRNKNKNGNNGNQ